MKNATMITQNELAKMWRESMRNWALIWRAWRNECPTTSALALESAKLRRDWAHEELAIAAKHAVHPSAIAA